MLIRYECYTFAPEAIDSLVCVKGQIKIQLKDKLCINTKYRLESTSTRAYEAIHKFLCQDHAKPKSIDISPEKFEMRNFVYEEAWPLLFSSV